MLSLFGTEYGGLKCYMEGYCYEDYYVGCSWSRKGTQAKKIAEKYDIPHISTGDIFRANIKTEQSLDRKQNIYGSGTSCTG